MNVYDWDGTIFDGDSSAQFILFLYKKRPWYLLTYGIKSAFAGLLYGLKIMPKERAKEIFFSLMLRFDDRKSLVEEFWDKNEYKIKDFYRKQKKKSDLIISASPLFLIGPVCKRLKVACMATPLDIKTGKYTGKNCHGEEKVKRLYELYPDCVIEEFYSDSHHDDPLAKIAKKAFFVTGNRIEKWSFTK